MMRYAAYCMLLAQTDFVHCQYVKKKKMPRHILHPSPSKPEEFFFFFLKQSLMDLKNELLQILAANHIHIT